MPMPDFSKMFSNLGNSINNDPSKFMVFADTIGKSLAPNGPFAGAGTSIGQSMIANKAYAQNRDDMKAFIAALSGQKAPVSPEAAPGTPATTTSALDKLPLTPAEMDGPTNYSVKTGKNGEKIYTVTGTQGGKKEGQSVNMSDMFSSPFFRP